MAALLDHKTVGAPFSNALEVVRVQYDFANDAGATGKLDVLTASEALVIHSFYVKGITELDSAADGASIDIGVDTTNEDVLIDGVAEATFAAGAIVPPVVVEGTPNVMALPLSLPAAGKINFTIVAEALTSGKCEMVFVIGRP